MNRKDKAIKVTRLSIIGNLFLALVKGITGYFGNSYALIADAVESTTDIVSSFLVLIGLRYSTRPPDEDHPYGHGKAEPLITFMVVAFLIFSAIGIAWQAVINIQTPHELPETYTIYVLIGVVIVKEIFFRIVSKTGEETKSTAVKGDAWHHRSDAITSLAALIGIGIAVFMGKGYESADDWAALLASVFILYNSFLIFRPALGEIMDEHTHHDLIEDIRKSASEVTGVINTEKCFIRKSGLNHHVDLHLTVNGLITVQEGHDIAHKVQEKIMLEIPGIAGVLIHVEPDTL